MALFAAWTIRRAEGLGIVAGCIALVLWLAVAAFQALLMPLIVALAITGFCGLSVLSITAVDLLAHAPRSDRLRPIRTFDIVVGLVLAIPSLNELAALLPDRLG